MDLVSSFAVWLQPLSIALTTPSFHNFALILTGCVVREAADTDRNIDPMRHKVRKSN
jgi:hypothetical protein